MANYALVQAGFGAPQRQSRWKAAFRAILAVPLLIWFALITFAVAFLIVISWFAALILGRVPASFVGPLKEYIIFQSRFYSYFFLMNDAYPPFSVKRDFGVNLEIPVTNVRRSAVLFRIVLLIPVGIVATCISVGIEIVSVFIWLIVLVKGEMPLTLFGALAAALRYQARFNAYLMMLTSKYPRELFGDQPVSDASALPEVVDSTDESVSITSEDADNVATDDTSNDESVTPTTTTDVDVGAALVTPGPTGAPVDFTNGEGTNQAPRTARLVLSRGSKRILVVLLIVGALGYTAEGILRNEELGKQTAYQRLSTANNTLEVAVAAAEAQERSCTLAHAACVQRYFGETAEDFGAFDVALVGTSFPSLAQSDARQFEKATAKFVALLDQLKAASSVTQTQVNRLGTLGATFDTDFQQVMSDLSSPI